MENGGKELTQWQIFDEIYNFINTEKYDKETTPKKITGLIQLIRPNELFFTVWGLNHYLIYNDFTRKMLDMFFQTSLYLDNIDYIYFYIKYMVQNGIKFPKYKYWYKPEINKTAASYRKIIKEKLNIDKENDLSDFIEYYSDKGISARDICFILKKI